MSIAGIELASLRGRRGWVVVRARIVLHDATVGEAKYPLKRVEEVLEFASIDKEIAKIEGRLHTLLKDLPVADIPSVELVLDDLFSKSNLDFRFAVSLALVDALAEQRGIDPSTLLGGEFISSVPLPIVQVTRLEGAVSAWLSLIPTGPIDDAWFLEPPLPPTLTVDLEQPEALATVLKPVLARNGLVADLRGRPLEGATFRFLDQVSDRIWFLLEPDELLSLGRLTPPNLDEILGRTLLHLSLDQVDFFRERVAPLLPVRSLVVSIPGAHSLSRAVAEVLALDDDGYRLVLDSRADTHNRLGLWFLARGLRFRHIWVENTLDNSLGVLNRATTLGRKGHVVVYRPLVGALPVPD